MTEAPRAASTRFAWLAIAAACVTIALKTGAWLMTGSVGLLSDALESFVNLVAAIVALVVLTVARKEPDEEHAYGHGKAEYLSSGLEGGLILIAAASIVLTAIPRLIAPEELDRIGIGIAASIAASLVNLLVARILLAAARNYESITLEADARHLITDVWTTAAVIAGILAVSLSGWNRLDPIIALVVALNIVLTGYNLMRRSILGLLDTALPKEEIAKIEEVLQTYRQTEPVQTHALRTRQAASRRFASVHVIVPGDWSIARGHDLVERIERDIRSALPSITVFTHLEPDTDPASWEDTGLDRPTPQDASKSMSP